MISITPSKYRRQIQTVTWEQVELFVQAATKFIKQKEPEEITGICGIPRGGLVLAVMLSYATKLPLFPVPVSGCLIVDDIADTGKTLARHKKEGYPILTMFYHPQSIVVPDFWMFEKKDKWIVYPWEEKPNIE